MSIKCLLNQPLRQALGMEQSLLQMTQLDGPVPDFSTVFRRQKKFTPAAELHPQHAASQFAGRQYGYQIPGRRGIQRKKHGPEYRRAWRKGYLGIDAQTLETSAIEVASGAMGDARLLPELMFKFRLARPWSASVQLVRMTRGIALMRVTCGGASADPRAQECRYFVTASGVSDSRNQAAPVCKRFGRRL